MKPIKLNVGRYNHSDSLKWVVGWRENGKRRRTFFENEQTARVWAEQKQIELGNVGFKALTMPDELRMTAITGAKRLRPYGKSLGDAVDHNVKYLEAVSSRGRDQASGLVAGGNSGFRLYRSHCGRICARWKQESRFWKVRC